MAADKLVAHLCLIAVTAFVIAKTADGSWYSWHPVLATLGFVGLMGEGILAMQERGSWVKAQFRSRATTHGYIQCTVAACLAVAFYVIYMAKNAWGSEHFASWHAQVGLVALCAALGSAVAGTVVEYGPRIKGLRSLHRQAGPYTWLLGLLAFSLAMVYTKTGASYGSVRYLLMGACAIAWVTTCLTPGRK